MTQENWRVWVDSGGTFTDIIAVSDKGIIKTHKLLTKKSGFYEHALIQGIKDLFPNDQFNAPPAFSIKEIRLGTTVATNALLERTGAATAFVTTEGFTDALTIGYQQRPDIFSVNPRRTPVLYDKAFAVAERVNAQGNIIKALDKQALKDLFIDIKQLGYNNLAICFMHSYANNKHELEALALAKKLRFKHISISCQVSNNRRFIPRASTTVLNAYLATCIDEFLITLKNYFAGTQLLVMQSNGGLIDAEQFQAKSAILSGPAGGVIGATKTALSAGYKKIIGFDMGGTSTDVFHYGGEIERQEEAEFDGQYLQTPMLSIHTIAAGGGSICYYADGRMQVGPQSAGAAPGPACYGFGGPLTITDCNLFLDRINLGNFPNTFGKSGNAPLCKQLSEQKLVAIQKALVETNNTLSLEEIANGFIRIAVLKIANAIRKLTTLKGFSIQDYCLVAYGGAAGQIVCDVAEALELKKIMIHPYAGLLSAFGMGLADQRYMIERSIDDIAKPTAKALAERFEQLEQATKYPEEQRPPIEIKRLCYLKYAHSNQTFPIALDTVANMHQAFKQQHQQYYSFTLEHEPIVITKISVETVIINSISSYPVNFDHDWSQVNQLHQSQTPRCWRLELSKQLTEENKQIGPLIIQDRTSTSLLKANWRSRIDDMGSLHFSLDKDEPIESDCLDNPINIEVFNHAFIAIAEQMGAVLAQAALSVNIKERLDFSCALFNASGELIANAPHMPVHLGSMGKTVLSVIEHFADAIHPGDAFIVNAPFYGGSHLPDITVVSPIFHDQKLVAFVASRAHHADVGGLSPGSMPAFSQYLKQEGVIIELEKIVADGQLLENKLKTLLLDQEHPVRNYAQNRADIIAQIAANNKGKNEFLALIRRYNLRPVQHFMQRLLTNADQSLKLVMAKLEPGRFSYAMDDGSQISISVSIDKENSHIHLDFSGTSAEQHNNFNAPLSVCRAAVLYVLRLIVGSDIPLNDGFMRSVTLHVDNQSLVNPSAKAAVVAGNVETSQVIVDCLLAAFQVCAGSQGTMNNVIIGNQKIQYYETIAGGAGAGPSWHGEHAIQTHMTNSRMTDPEILEQRVPIQVESFQVRTGSGGEGNFKGGDGTVRELLFIEELSLSIISNRRQVAPFGLQGGSSGCTGKNLLIRKNGTTETLPSCISLNVYRGDRLIIQTPGGGGFGHSNSKLTN